MRCLTNYITYDRLLELLEYLPDIGKFKHKLNSKNNTHRIGKIAGANNSQRQDIVIKLDGVRYREHQLVWLAETKLFPTYLIGHIDNDNSNNKFNNLYELSNRNRVIDYDNLIKILEYDEYSGDLIWKDAPFNKKRIIGSVAGTTDGNDIIGKYIKIKINGIKYPATHLIWLMKTKSWPMGLIDHYDHNTLNNKFENLRDVTFSENSQNRINPQSNNKLGVLGVSFTGNKYTSRINIEGKRHNLGSFDTKEEAYDSYLLSKKNLHINTIITDKLCVE